MGIFKGSIRKRKIAKEDESVDGINNEIQLSMAVTEVTVTKDCPEGFLKQLEDFGVKAKIIYK